MPVGSQFVIPQRALYIRKIIKWQTLATTPMSTADHFSLPLDLRLPNYIQICVLNVRCLFDPGKGVIGNSLRPPGIFTKTRAAIPVPAFVLYRIHSLVTVVSTASMLFTHRPQMSGFTPVPHDMKLDSCAHFERFRQFPIVDDLTRWWFVKVLDQLNELWWNSIVMHKLPDDIPVNTVKGLSKSIKFMYNGVCHSLDCSMIILRVAIWSVQDLPFLKPAWLHHSCLSTAFLSLSRIMQQNTLLGIEMSLVKKS